jgi:short-subunit dehydrogenase
MGTTRTALVTGATSGIGYAVAVDLAQRGYRVVGTGRDTSTGVGHADGVEYVDLDLTYPESVEKCAAAVGDVDILVNNAGESQCGPLEELPQDELQRIFQLNVFGPVHLTQLLLPGMRARGYGRVVMVGSMLASFPVAFRSSYVASKAAIKGFATSARAEVEPYGVKITTVEPGAINTGISTRRNHCITADSVYGDGYRTVIGKLDANEAVGISAPRVARTIVSAIEAENPKPLYAVGSRAPLAFAVRRVVPDAVMEKIVLRQHDIH